MKHREGLWIQKKASVSFKEERAENDVLLGLWHKSLMYVLHVSAFCCCRNVFGSCLQAPLCLAGEANVGKKNRSQGERREILSKGESRLRRGCRVRNAGKSLTQN